MNIFNKNPFSCNKEVKIATQYSQVTSQNKIDSIRNLMGGDLSIKVDNKKEPNQKDQSNFDDLQTRLNNLKNKKF